MPMNIREYKDAARKVVSKIHKQDVKPAKFKAEYIGIQHNTKGNFYSALFEFELVIKTPQGELNILKNVQIPLNYRVDVNVYEKPEK